MNLTARFGLSLLAAGLLFEAASAQTPDAATSRPADYARLAAASPAIPLPFSTSGAAGAEGTGVFAGAGLYVLQPAFQNNPAYTVFLQTTKDTTLDPKKPTSITLSESAHRVDVQHLMSAAPLIWLGYETEAGLGVRASGWGFQQGTSQAVALAPFVGKYRIGTSKDGHPVIVADGSLATVSSATPLGLEAFGDTLSIQHGPEATVLTVTTKLAVQVYDLEATQRYQDSVWTLLVSGGARYVRLSQAYNAYDFQSTSAAELRTLSSSYDFNGIGPTMAFDLRRRIAESGLSLYGHGRASIVFGSAHQNAVFFGQELRNDDPNPQFATQNRDRALPILDFESGLEYGRTIGRTWVFGQIGVVGQEWFNAGSASRSTMLNVAGSARPVLGGAPLDSNLAFLGLAFRVGLYY